MLSRIDVEPLREVYRGTGSKPYPPELMLALVIVEILIGRTSPAHWAADASTRDQCKLVGQGITPSRTACYEFRNRASKIIDNVHEQITKDATDSGLIEPVEASVDGTFAAASASRHKIFNLKQINRRLSKLKRAIRLLDDPHRVAPAKPLGKIPKWIAKTATGRLRQLATYREAKQEILNKIHENRQAHSRYRRDESKIVLSPVDPEAVIGRDKFEVLRPLYNVQYVTDCQSGVVLSFEVFRQNNDNSTLGPMVERSQRIVGPQLKTIHADAGYCSILDIKDCARLGVDLRAPVQNNTMQQRKLANGQFQIPSGEFNFDSSTGALRCPNGHPMMLVRTVEVPRACGRMVPELRFEQLEEKCNVCPLAARCIGDKSKRRTVSRQKEQHLLDAQQNKMSGEEGRRSRGKRGGSVERSFGDRKRHRCTGHQSGRGLLRVRTEVGLVAIAQNILLLYNREKRRENVSP